MRKGVTDKLDENVFEDFKRKVAELFTETKNEYITQFLNYLYNLNNHTVTNPQLNNDNHIRTIVSQLINIWNYPEEKKNGFI